MYVDHLGNENTEAGAKGRLIKHSTTIMLRTKILRLPNAQAKSTMEKPQILSRTGTTRNRGTREQLKYNYESKINGKWQPRNQESETGFAP